jgi:hypothetical protein
VLLVELDASGFKMHMVVAVQWNVIVNLLIGCKVTGLTVNRESGGILPLSIEILQGS